MFLRLAENSDALAAAPQLTGGGAFGLSKRSIDEVVKKGPFGAGVHEIFAAGQRDFAASLGFALALAFREAAERTVLFARHDFLDAETGCLNASGLSELGLRPSGIIVVRARDFEDALRTAEQGARCGALGAVLVALWGVSNLLDLTASRRLSLASQKSGVPIFLLRSAAPPSPSAAATRWIVEAAPSRPLAANAPGYPAFGLSLVRHRGGSAGRTWCVEWDRDAKCFHDQKSADAAPLPRSVVSASADRSHSSPASQQRWQKAG